MVWQRMSYWGSSARRRVFAEPRGARQASRTSLSDGVEPLHADLGTRHSANAPTGYESSVVISALCVALTQRGAVIGEGVYPDKSKEVIDVRLPSSYSFYRDYWGYEKRSSTKQGIAFARAIQDFNCVTQAALVARSFEPFSEYEADEYARALTIRFLTNLRRLSLLQFASPFDSLSYEATEIVVPRHLLGRRELIVPTPYLRADEPPRAIFLTFGGTDRIAQEMSALFGLINHFGVRNGRSPGHVPELVYWDVVDCGSARILADELNPVDYDSLLGSARRLSA